jgi:hypothetical protein
MLLTIAVILIILWLAGFLGHVGGSLVHIALVVGLILIVLSVVH